MQPVVIALSVTGGVIVIGLLALFYYDRASKKAKQSKINRLKVTPWNQDSWYVQHSNTAAHAAGVASGRAIKHTAEWGSSGESLESDASYSDSSVDESSDPESSENLFNSSCSQHNDSLDNQNYSDNDREYSSARSNSSSEHSASELSVPIATAGRIHQPNRSRNRSESHSSLGADEWWQSVMDDMDQSSESDD